MASNAKRVSVAIAVFVVVIAVVIATEGLRTRPLEFDSDSWRHTPSLRPRMLSDLLAKHELKGAALRDVHQLLGEPTGQDSARDDRYIYWVGYNGIDDEWLELDFQKNVVIGVRICPD